MTHGKYFENNVLFTTCRMPFVHPGTRGYCHVGPECSSTLIAILEHSILVAAKLESSFSNRATAESLVYK